jgi:hypothetical protein
VPKLVPDLIGRQLWDRSCFHLCAALDGATLAEFNRT